MAGKKKKPKKPKKAEAPKPETDSSEEKSGKGGLIGAILTPLVLGGVSFGMVYSLPGSPAPVEESVPETDSLKEEKKAEIKIEAKPVKIVELSEFTVSLRRDRQVLRILIALETPEANKEEIDPSDPRLRDAFMSYLRAVEVEKLEDISFLPNLRAQLLRRAKLALGEENVSGILITDFLIR